MKDEGERRAPPSVKNVIWEKSTRRHPHPAPSHPRSVCSPSLPLSPADRNAAVAVKKRPQKSALSLDAFARAKRSTYDKRVVLEKKRNLAAAKVNKYRKVQKRLGDTVEVGTREGG